MLDMDEILLHPVQEAEDISAQAAYRVVQDPGVIARTVLLAYTWDGSFFLGCGMGVLENCCKRVSICCTCIYIPHLHFKRCQEYVMDYLILQTILGIGNPGSRQPVMVMDPSHDLYA